MPVKRSRARGKSRRVVDPAAAACAPAARHLETWRSVAGEELRCELFAATDDSVACGIMHEPTRAVEVDDLPAKWPAGACACDSAQLACGHVFHPVAIALHFLVSDMRCPVCRTGPAGPMAMDSVPPPMREAYAAKLDRVRSEAQSPEDLAQLRADIEHVLSHLELGFVLLGADSTAAPRAMTRTRVVFEPGDVDAIEQQVLQSTGSAAQDAHTLSGASASTFNVHRSFQRLARAIVARQLERNAAGGVRFVLAHPLVPVPICSRDMTVDEAWHGFFNAPVRADVCDAGGDAPRLDVCQPRPVPLFCAAVAGAHPVGYLKAHFADASAAPHMTAELNTLMLVNIATYVRQVLESIRDAVELHTGFDAHTSVEITAEAINGLRFQL